MARKALCECGKKFTVESNRGPLPKLCPKCKKEAKGEPKAKKSKKTKKSSK